LALLDAEGRTVERIGAASEEEEALAEPLAAAARAGRSAAFGPEASGWPAVVALVPLPATGDATRAARTLRLDLPAHALAAQQRTLALLTPLVLGLTIAASIVVALFFRALLRPYETLLARARAAGGGEGRPAGETGDELDFLVATFDRALAALGAPAGDLAPLAGTLGRELEGGFLLLDPERRVLVATPAATELLGAPAPAPGTPLAEAFPIEPELAAELDRALLADVRVPRGTLRASRASRALGYTAEPLRGESGRERGWLVVLADLTQHERREARDRLAEGLAQLGELSAGVAHELRNGLAALRGWIELALRRSGSDELPDLLAEIDRESRELARVVDDFLAFARPGTRRDERFDLGALLARVAAGAGEAGAGESPAIELRLPAETAHLAGDPSLLERALRNVAANALRAERDAGRPGPVVIELAGETDAWRIRIADRGAGIPAEVRARLFEPFATGRPDGVGLGLALARRIVVLHGGEIAARDRPGGGTEVEILLPSGPT
jgi:signal transduction histidine kinase